MDTPLTLACPACAAVNRVDPARLAAGPVCGRCQASLLPDAPFAVDAAGLARHIAHSSVPVVIDFWAPWCAPCRAFAPVFAASAARRGSTLRFIKLDTEAEPRAAAAHDIRSIPTLAVFRDGREVARVSGALPQARFEAWLDQSLSARPTPR